MVEVTPQNQLKVKAESISQQHFISSKFGRTFQVDGNSVTLTSATHTVLHLKNNDAEKDLVVSYIRMQLVGASTADNLTDYFELGFDRTVTSDGTAKTPVNMNRGVGVVASVTATDGAGTTPTMAGTFVSAEKWYPKASGELNTFNKDGSLMLGFNDTLEIRYVGTSTTGNAYARITFMMVDKNGD